MIKKLLQKIFKKISYFFFSIIYGKIDSSIKSNEDKIIQALQDDLHKPKMEAYFSEIVFCYKEIDHAIKHLEDWMAPTTVGTPLALQPGKSQIYNDARGSVLIIAPWNYPFQLTISPLIAAIAGGNAAVLKPSEMAKNIQALLVEMINNEFEEELIHCIGGAVTESQMLLKLPFDFIFFTSTSWCNYDVTY